MRAEVCVEGIQVLTAEEDRCIVVGGNPVRVRGRGSGAFLVGRVEHQLHAVESEKSPVEIIPLSGLRCADDLDAQNVAVKGDCAGHIEYAQEGGKAFDL